MTSRSIAPARRAAWGRRAARGFAHYRHGAGWCVALAGLAWLAALPVRAQEPAATPVAESAPLRFARHDLARWTAQGQKLTEAVSQAQSGLDAANRAVAEIKGAQAAAEKLLADSGTAATAAQQAKADAAKSVAAALEAEKVALAEKKDDVALTAAKSAVDAAARALETANQQLAAAAAGRKQAEARKAEADKQLPEFEAAVKPATEAKAAADKALAEAQPLLKRAAERLAAFEKAPPAPDPAATRLVQTFTHDRPNLACRFDAAGDVLFAGAEDNAFHRWDLFSPEVARATVHKSWLGAMACLPGPEGIVLTGGHEGKLTWWNAAASPPAALRTVDAHKGYIRAVTASPDGKLVATAGNDLMVRVWSAGDGTLVKELAGHTRHVYNVAFHPSGTALVSGDLLGIVKQWSLADWSETRELDAKVLWKYDTGFRADVGGVRSFAFSADGKYLAAAGITDVSNAFAGIGTPCVVLFDWESGKQLKVMKPRDAFQGSVYGVRFSPAGDFLVAAGGGGAGGLWFWKLDDEKSFQAIGLPSVAYDLDLHPDGLRLAVALYDKTLRVYDLAPKFEATPQP